MSAKADVRGWNIKITCPGEKTGTVMAKLTNAVVAGITVQLVNSGTFLWTT